MDNFLLNIKKKKPITTVTFIGITLYYAIITLQGIDVCDEGFLLASYQQIFSSPETIESNHLVWLTTIIGGICYKIFPMGGVISFRILGAIIIIITMFFTRSILKNYIQNRYILIGLLMIMVSKGYGVVNFSYNTLAGFMSVIISLFLIKGIIKQNLTYLYISGLFLGIGTFCSLPFITIVVLLLAIPFYQYINSKIKFRIVFKNMTLFISGILSGIGLVLCLMYLLGHLDIFKDAIYSLLSHSKASDSNHNLVILSKKYILDYIKTIKLGSFLILGTFILITLKRYIKSNSVNLIWKIVSFLFFAFIIKVNHIYSTYFVCLAGTIWIIIDAEQKKELRLIAFIGLLIALFLPIGTDPGIHSIGHVSIWLSIPLFLSTISKSDMVINIKYKSNTLTTYLNKNSLMPLLKLYVIAFFVVKIISISGQAYFDPGCRIHKIHQIDSQLTKHIYTTKKRATIINKALEKLNEVVKPNDYLLVYDKMPMLHYLTNTKPYLYNQWIWCYDSYNFNEKIKKAEREINVLPPVLVHKFETIFAFSEPIEDYLDENKPATYLNRTASHKYLKDFLVRNKYEITWQNEYYSLYQTGLIK